MKYDIALFDFDGTIVDSEETVVEAILRTFRDVNFPLPTRENIIHGMGIPIEKEFSRLAERDLSEKEVAELLATFRAYIQEIEEDYLVLFPYMKELLVDLSEVARLAIVTSKASGPLKRQLQFLGVAEHFDVFVSADMVKNFKPAPETALVALEKLGVTSTESVLVIGDSTYDMLMGQNAGVATCAVTWGAHSAELLTEIAPTHMVDDPRDLLQFFK